MQAAGAGSMTVSNLYAGAASTAPNGRERRNGTSRMQARPGRLGLPTVGLEGRHQTSRSRGTLLGLQRSRAVCNVPTLYPDHMREILGFFAHCDRRVLVSLCQHRTENAQ